MELTVEATPTATVIRVHASRIDVPTALQFKEDMRSLTARQDGRFILDLQSVQFIDSSGLGAVVASMKQLRPGQALELAALQPIVEKVFRLTRMDTDLYDPRDGGTGRWHWARLTNRLLDGRPVPACLGPHDSADPVTGRSRARTVRLRSSARHSADRACRRR